jgi:hypothetical protein
MERVKGIEPSSEAWEAVIRPLKSLVFFSSSFNFSVFDFHPGSGRDTTYNAIGNIGKNAKVKQ